MHTHIARFAPHIQSASLSFTRLESPKIARKFGYLEDGYRDEDQRFDASRFERQFESVRTNGRALLAAMEISVNAK